METSNAGTRVFLSGGGLRAVVGSTGTILFLIQSGRWSDVREIASVSGGSIVNAALLTAGGHTNDELTDRERLSHLFRNLLQDRARPLRTFRRKIVCALLAALVVAAIGAVVVAAGGWVLDGQQAPIAGVVVGTLVFPVSLQLGRRLVSAYIRDVIATITESRTVALADVSARPRIRDRNRRQIICASGLVSRAPYFFYAGPPESTSEEQADGRGTWGYPIRPTSEQNDYTVADAAMASASLPTVGSVRSPRSSSVGDGHLFGVQANEPLVDGGASGIFGDQLRLPFATSLGRISTAHHPSSAPTVMVDTFRHGTVPSKRTGKSTVLAAVRDRMSTILHLIGWVKVVTESLYINDVLDVATNPEAVVLRLCETQDRFLPAEHARLDTATEERIALLKDQLSSVGLFNLTPESAAAGVTVGFVEAWVRFNGTTDGLEAALVDVGSDFLGESDPDRLIFAESWRQTAHATIDLTGASPEFAETA